MSVFPSDSPPQLWYPCNVYDFEDAHDNIIKKFNQIHKAPLIWIVWKTMENMSSEYSWGIFRKNARS